MKRRIKIIVALTFLLCGNIFSQPHLAHLLTKKTLTINGPQVLTAPYAAEKPVVDLTGNQAFFSTRLPTRMILPDYYTRNFGFVCQKEWQFEKSTKIPLRFRLGSLEYCNRLEGK